MGPASENLHTKEGLNLSKSFAPAHKDHSLTLRVSRASQSRNFQVGHEPRFNRARTTLIDVSAHFRRAGVIPITCEPHQKLYAVLGSIPPTVRQCARRPSFLSRGRIIVKPHLSVLLALQLLTRRRWPGWTIMNIVGTVMFSVLRCIDHESTIARPERNACPLRYMPDGLAVALAGGTRAAGHSALQCRLLSPGRRDEVHAPEAIIFAATARTRRAPWVAFRP